MTATKKTEAPKEPEAPKVDRVLKGALTTRKGIVSQGEKITEEHFGQGEEAKKTFAHWVKKGVIGKA